MKAESVSWMSPTEPLRSTAITGSAGRYMSMERGVKAESSASNTSRTGVRVGLVTTGGGAETVVIVCSSSQSFLPAML